jgi:hypothetical protein
VRPDRYHAIERGQKALDPAVHREFQRSSPPSGLQERPEAAQQERPDAAQRERIRRALEFGYVPLDLSSSHMHQGGAQVRPSGCERLKRRKRFPVMIIEVRRCHPSRWWMKVERLACSGGKGRRSMLCNSCTIRLDRSVRADLSSTIKREKPDPLARRQRRQILGAGCRICIR